MDSRGVSDGVTLASATLSLTGMQKGDMSSWKQSWAHKMAQQVRYLPHKPGA